MSPRVGQGTDPQTSTEELRARLLETERALAAAEKARQAELEMARRRVEDARAKFNAGLLSSSELMEIELELARAQARGDARAEREAELVVLERHMRDLQVMVEIGTASALDVAKLQGDIAHLESLRQDSSGLLAARAALESATVQLARTRELFEKGLVSQFQLQSAELKIREAGRQLANTEARVSGPGREEDRVRQAGRQADADRQELEQRYKALQRLYEERLSAARRRDATVASAEPVDPSRPIAAGDVLSVAIEGEPDLPPTYFLREDGTIRILFLGTFKVAGQTAAQVRDAIGKALADRRLGSASQVTVTARRAIRRTAVKR